MRTTSGLSPDKKTEGELAPAAVAVATPEEAEMLNEFAVFLSSAKKTVVEGEITERSDLPEPEKSDYPNCRFTVHFLGNSIKSGEPCPKEIVLIVDGFENYKVLETEKLKSGDKVQCTIISYDDLPEEMQSTQQADDLSLFLFENYYVVNVRKINAYSDDPFMPRSGIFFSDGNEKYVSLFLRHINPPSPQSINDAQKISIRDDLQRMNDFLKKYDDDYIKKTNEHFDNSWKKEKDKDKNGYNRVGSCVWRNIDNSFWCLPANYSLLSKAYLLTQETLDSFAALKNACDANGVHLIVSFVPNLYVISARVINKDFKNIIDIQTATFVKQLSEIGIESIYPSEAIIQNYSKYPFAFFYPTNAHPSDTTQDTIANILCERIKRYNIQPDLDKDLFSLEMKASPYCELEHHVFPSNCDIGENIPQTTYNSICYFYNNKPIQKNSASPILLIGNSYIQSPGSSSDYLPSAISYKLHTSVDWYRINAGGPFVDILVQILTRPSFFFLNKKVIIMQIGTDQLRKTNENNTMLNIAKVDNERVLLNNKKMKGHSILCSNVETNQIVDTSLWGHISNIDKAVLSIGESGELIFKIPVEKLASDISDSEPFICLIPHMCTRNTSCRMIVNGINKAMLSPNYSEHSRFFNLTYELPAGTKEITIKIEGKPGTHIAIKDIQIWQ